MKLDDMLSSVERNLSRYTTSENEEYINRILKAIKVVDRKFFVEGSRTYYDTALPIGSGQTISQPSTVARMLLLLGLEEGLSVLEVGSGSGWNASLTAFLVDPGRVLSLDVKPELVEKAKSNLEEFNKDSPVKMDNVEFKERNIFKKPAEKSFHRVIFTAGMTKSQELEVEKVAESLLKEEGLLLVPYRSGPLLTIKKEDSELKKSFTKERYRFVPLITE